MPSEAAVVVTQNILGCWVGMATGTWDGCGCVDCTSGRDACEGFDRGVVTKGREHTAGLLTMTRGGVSGVLIWRETCRLPWTWENVGGLLSSLFRSNPDGILLGDFNSLLSVISEALRFTPSTWGVECLACSRTPCVPCTFSFGDPSFSRTFLLSRSLVASEQGGLWTGLIAEEVHFFIWKNDHRWQGVMGVTIYMVRFVRTCWTLTVAI